MTREPPLALADVSRAVATTPALQTLQAPVADLLAAELERDVGPTEPDDPPEAQVRRVDAVHEAAFGVFGVLGQLEPTPVTEAIYRLVVQFYLTTFLMHAARRRDVETPGDAGLLAERRRTARVAERANLDLRVAFGVLTQQHAQLDDPDAPDDSNADYPRYAQAIQLARACGHAIAEVTA